MDSDDTMTTVHSSMHENENGVEDEDDHDHPHHPINLSRLSMCTKSSKHSMYDNDDDDMGLNMSRLSMEGSDGDADADEELSDEKEGKGVSEMSSDSDKERGCYSVPATPPRRRVGGGSVEYVSENEAGKGHKPRKDSRRRIVRERWIEEKKKKYRGVDGEEMEHESECLVITRPKGGRRCLCMDLDEVKACRDLGFELEHERMLEIPSRISISGSPIDTSSGGNSPIANWRISSPGDDPRDVKARLKVWAQAVALASTSRLLS